MSKKITELTLLNSASLLDLIPILDVSETAERKTKKITVQALLDSVTVDGESVGDGYDVFKEISGTTLRFRTITGGTNITITENTNDIEISYDNTLPTITTTDDTPYYTTLATLAVGDVVQIDMVVKITSADAAVRQVFKLSGIYYGAAGPTATLEGSLTSTSTGTGAAVATIDVNSDTVRFVVTGIAATTLTTTYDVSII